MATIGKLTVSRVGPTIIGKVAVPAELKFGATKVGQFIHDAFEGVLRKSFPGSNFKMHTNVGQTGVDAILELERGVNPGFRYGELKPNTRSGKASFETQLKDWGLGTDEVQPFSYDKQGNVYVGFP